MNEIDPPDAAVPPADDAARELEQEVDALDVLRAALDETSAAAATGEPELAEEARAPLDPGPAAALELDALPRVQYAMHANDVRVVRELRLVNPGDEPLREVRLSLRAEPAFCAPFELAQEDLRPGEARRIEEPALALDHAFLDRLTERVEAALVAELHASGELVARAEHRVAVLARNEWPGDRIYPELLAAFVLPNEPAVARLLAEAGRHLARWSGSPSIDGYQQQDPEAALRQAAAIYEALRAERLQYVGVPASFEREGQRVRLPAQVLEQRQANCLDLSCLAAAALEQAGLHPLVVLVEGHAFVGAWLEESSLPEASSDDPARLRNHLENRDLVLFDPTAAVAGNDADFEAARELARLHLAEDARFRWVIDVHRARRGKVRPLPSLAAPAPGRAGEEAPDPSAPLRDGGGPGTGAGALAPRPRESKAPEPGPARVEAWKRRLLDLSMRNRLLNVPEKGRLVRLLAPDVPALEDALAEGATFKIRQRPPELGEERQVGAGGERRRLTAADLRPFLLQEQQSGVLFADMEAGPLETRLTALLREARTAEEEGGSSNLYLALGFLKLFETGRSQRPRLAPIVLVPVALRRRTASEGILLEPRAEDARINVTLLRYLEETHGVRVDGVDPPPDDGSGLDLPLVFRRFREEILAKRGWEVLEEARLGMFSFARILIWRDLDEYSGRLLESRVVRHLVETPRERYDDGVEFGDPRELDERTRSADTFVPLSADSSQLAAIVAAAEGKSFVLIGPPGTGKSQTITNLITHCLATGRTVLFVSEKMAALEVVHRRLKDVGLEESCLELHSDKAKKKEVLAQLAASLEDVAATPDVPREEVARELDAVRERLNGYVRALHRRRPSGEAVFQVLSRLIGLKDAPRVELGWRELDATSAERLLAARAALAELQGAAETAAVGPGHALGELGQTKYTPLWEREAKAALGAAEPELRALDGVARVVRPALLGELEWPGYEAREPLLRAARLLRAPERIATEALCAADWAATEREAEAALAELAALRTERAHFAVRYAGPCEVVDARGLAAELEAVQRAWFLPRFFGRRRWLERFTAAARPQVPLDLDDAAADLSRMAALQERAAGFGAHAARAERVFGGAWRGEESDVDALRRALRWARELREAARELARGEGERSARLVLAWARLATGERDAALDEALARLEERWEAAAQAARAVRHRLRLADDGPWTALDVEACLAQRERWLAGWSGLRAWCRWRAAREVALEHGLAALVAALETGAVAPPDATRAFERSYAEEWYLHTISADDALAGFESEDHERAIERFRRLDDELCALTRASVRARIDSHARSRASLQSGVQGAFLRREIQKQRRHKPIRVLFREAGDLVRELRPCLLMSPLSVAQYLDPHLPRFDLVVFDEASQMPTWEAVGAAARGEQLIVVGDPKQLPPTSFFAKSDSGGSDDGGDEELETEDLESVLDELLASNVAQHTLSWHYRSRHESLIAFSNRNYYEGRLVTFPAAAGEGLGVSWHAVTGGVYDRGGSRTNRAEAEALVAEIRRRLSDPELSRRSIGVVTLSQPQQGLVLDLLDALRREHPELEPFFGDAAEEPVFVKNLENVQGDERDVILFTVCYGPDLAGKVAHNFGPLNQEGGWRRLNVAITRARREILVFSTLRWDQIDLDRTRSAGVRDLKRFLQYAEQGDASFARELAVAPASDLESPFEAEVARELEARGHTVHRQVGCSGHRIDLAIVDPARPGRYLLGIECDGASYRGAPSARDRDKLRQQVLAGLGWRLHRVWSSDWWEDRERELEAISAAIEAAAAPASIAAEEAVEPARFGAAASAVVPEPATEPGTAACAATGADPADGPREEVEPASPGDAPPAADRGGAELLREREREPEREAAAPPSHASPRLPTTTAERVELVLAAVLAGASTSAGLSPYRATPAEPRGSQARFYEPSERPRIAAALRDVVRAEAPVLDLVAARRVGELWGFARLQSKAIERILACTAEAGVHAVDAHGERVLWPDATAAESWRGARVPHPADPRSARPIAEIPLVELTELLRSWIDEAGPMGERELFDHAVRTLGFRSLGAKIKARLEAALELALERGHLARGGELLRRQS